MYLFSPKQSEGFPVVEKMRRSTSTSHKIDNSLAFLMIPVRLFEYVTCRPPVVSNFWILSLFLPIYYPRLK